MSRVAAFIDRIKRFKGPIVAIAGIGAVLSGLVGYYTTYKTVATATAISSLALAVDAINPLSILVLPFANQTGDPQKGYIADAMTSTISSDLIRIRDVFVVPATTAFAYKDKNLTLTEVASKAGVRFVLQGSVQSAGEHLRISAQLVDGQTGTQLWNESFDGELSKLFALQDQVTNRIGFSIGPEMVVRAARENERRNSNPKVGDLLLRAKALLVQPQSAANYSQRAVLYREVLKREPDNVEALAGLAAALVLKANNFMDGANPAQHSMYEEGHALALRAKALDSTEPLINAVLSTYAISRHDLVGARRLDEARLALDPKDMGAYNDLADDYFYSGEPERAIALLKRAITLHPKAPASIFSGLSRAYLMQGDDEAAVAWGLKATDRNSTLVTTYAQLAMAYANQGDMPNAAIHATHYRQLAQAEGRVGYPEIVIAEYPAAYNHYIQTLYIPQWKKAGLP